MSFVLTHLTRLSSSSRAVFFVAWIALAAAGGAWAAATPLSGSPDEPAHLIKAASVVRGELIGEPGADPSRTIVHVPVGIAEAWNWACYAHDAALSASCVTSPANGLELAEAETSAGLYNPLYYAIVGLPSLVIADTVTAVMAMRVISAVLVAALLAYSFSLLLRLLPPLLAGIGFLAVLTPMTLFLTGAVNPNALEISAAVALVSGLAAVCLAPNEAYSRSALIGIALAGVLLANARAISPLWMAVIAVSIIAMTPAPRLALLLRQRSVLAVLAALGIGAIAAVSWVARTGSLTSLGVFAGAGTTSPAEAFLSMIVQRGADPGIIGLFGWVDTPAPTFVYAFWSALLGATLIAGFVVARGRNLAGFLIAAAGALLGPAAAQAASVATSGYIWQGRYSIAPIAVAVLLAVIAVAAQRGAPWSGAIAVRLAATVGFLVVVGHLASMAAAIVRYATVGSGSFGALFVGEWSPPGGALVWLVILAVAITLIVILWIGAILASRASADEGLRPAAAGNEALEHLG